jgi:flagellar biosynthesis protein FlhB
VAGELAPTPQRRALARRAGMVPASPAWAAAGAWAGAIIALVAAGGAGAGALHGWAARQVAAAAEGGAIARAGAIDVGEVMAWIARLAAPIVVAAAVAGLIAHGALVRGVWLPRRRMRGAPIAAMGGARRAGDAAMAAARGAVVLAAAMHFAIAHLGDAARLGARGAEAGGSSALALALVAAGLAHVAIAAVAAGAIDALERVRRHRDDLRMTGREQREEARQAHGDPRWRSARRRAAGMPAIAAVRTATVVVVGERVAAAVRWHAREHPVPVVVARGRGAAAAQLVALARRSGVPAVHAPDVAVGLVAAKVGEPVPERMHAAVAGLLATQART